MKKLMKLTIGIDIDDVLMPCTSFAVELANKEKNLNPPIKTEDICQWGRSGTRTDIIFEYFNQLRFYESQTPFPGAVEMLEKLSEDGHEVIIITAVEPRFMQARINSILKHFPMVLERNIILGTRKDLVKIDVLLDDRPLNIKLTKATYPILFRRPWNTKMSGMMSVSNYDEFLYLIEQLSTSSFSQQKIMCEPSIICLIGPSGSGKTNICKQLSLHPAFDFPTSYTTATLNSINKDNYTVVTEDIFDNMFNQGAFAETTFYANNKYGFKTEDIDNILKSGKHVIIPIDISGANKLKFGYRGKVFTIFISNKKDDIIKNILNRNIPNEEKYHRIISLESEFSNEPLCDYVISSNDESDAINKIIRLGD